MKVTAGCSVSFTLPDSDWDSDSNSERFPFGYMLKVYIAQIQPQIPIPNGCVGNPSPNLESGNVNEPLVRPTLLLRKGNTLPNHVPVYD